MSTPLSNLSEAEIERLNYERYAYPQPIVQKRINCVYLKAKLNLSNQLISSIVGLHYNTVAHWLMVYENKSYEGLLSNNYGTNTSDLEAHSESILSSFAQKPPINAAEAAQRIYEMVGIDRSQQQVRGFMKRHKLKFIKCGHIPSKANNEAQHKWAETELKPVIEAAQQGEVHLFFCDASHFVLQPFLCSLWCAFRVFIKASAGRNRINVLGAVHAITKEIITLSNTTYITSDTLIEFLKMLKKKFSDKPIAIVLDNARYQHCFVVKAIASGLGIHLLFLPPYSPNLNIIERLWKFTKKKILYAKYYDKPADFHSAIQSFFITINQKYQTELKSLLSLKFQFFDKSDSLIYPL
jgi:transposase